MKPTSGPWRWQVDMTSKRVTIVGGGPKYDLTVVDFVRWGMGAAAPRFREDVDRMNIMNRVEQWAAPVKGREHHSHWFRTIDHPDARLIEAAPTLLELVEQLVDAFHDDPLGGQSRQGELVEIAKGVVRYIEEGPQP